MAGVIPAIFFKINFCVKNICVNLHSISEKVFAESPERGERSLKIRKEKCKVAM